MRQRLIGGVLLLVLAAILAPLIFRSPEQVRVALEMNIPTPPAVEQVELEPVVSEQAQAAVEQRITEERNEVTAEAEATLEAQALPATSGEAPERQSAAESTAEPTGAGEDDGDDQPQSGGQQEDPALAGYVVQVGSFSDAENAQSLVDRLKAADYRAFYRQVEQDGNRWQRVFVGPDIKKADAEQTRERLANDKDFALQGLVRTFVP